MSIEKRIQGNSDSGLDGYQTEFLRTVHNYRLGHWIIQSMIGEERRHPLAEDDEIWWNLHDLELQNGLPDNLNADDLYQLYRSNYAQPRRNIH